MKKKPHLTLILPLKNLFKERNIPYPLIYNSYDLLLLFDKLHITNNNCTTRVVDFTSLFTPTYHTMTLLEPSSWAENCLICLTFIGTIYFNNLNEDETILLLVIAPITYQGVAMDSYHSQQIVELVVSLSKFSLFNNTNCPTK